MLGIIDDSWSRYVDRRGQRRPGPGARAASTCCCRPATPARCRTATSSCARARTATCFFFRGFMVNGDLRPAVENTKKYYRVYPLAQAANPPAMKFVERLRRGLQHDPRQRRVVLRGGRPTSCRRSRSTPSTRRRAACSPPSASAKDKPFAPDARMQRHPHRGRRRRQRHRARLVFSTPRSARPTSTRTARGRCLRSATTTSSRRPGVLNLDARTFFFYYATGITPGDDGEDGRRRLAVRRRRSRTPRAGTSTAARPTGCTCRRTSRPRTSGRSSCTTRRRARCCRPTSGSPASAARRRASSSTPTPRWTSTSARAAPAGHESQLDPDHPRQGMVRHPAPLRPARAVVRQDLAARRDRTGGLTRLARSPSTSARWSRSSTRPGGRTTS